MAAKLKDAWVPLANAKVAIDEIFIKLDVGKYSYLCPEAIKTVVQFDSVSSKYELNCNKVCEILRARSLARPEPENVKRKELIKKVTDMVKSLGGTLWPELNLLMTSTQQYLAVRRQDTKQCGRAHSSSVIIASDAYSISLYFRSCA